MLESRFILAVPVLVLVAAAGLSRATSSAATAMEVRVSPSHSAPQTAQPRKLTLTLAPTGNEARYRVREQLVGFSLPNDAVGKTDKLSGSITLQSNGTIVKEGSKFTVDLTAITSDQGMRDNYVRRNTLETTSYPSAEFVPTSATGLPSSLPVAADLKFRLIGDFTVHGVTKSTSWDVEGKMLGTGEFTGTAKTSFKFADFGMSIPRVARVVSVVDSITLELDLRLLPGSVQR